MCIGALMATVLSIYQEKLARHFGKISSTPEGRLYFSCIECALLPVGLFWFGWTSFSFIHWIVPALAVGCATMGIFSIYLAVFNYLADTYHRYASSALAAQSFCRNMLGGVFPLITDAMFTRMTFAGAASFLGGVGAVLTMVPWVLVFYGPQIRARSRFASVSNLETPPNMYEAHRCRKLWVERCTIFTYNMPPMSFMTRSSPYLGKNGIPLTASEPKTTRVRGIPF